MDRRPGWMENVKGMIALDADTYVTGHGDLMTKDDVKKKLAYIQDSWDKVKAHGRARQVAR